MMPKLTRESIELDTMPLTSQVSLSGPFPWVLVAMPVTVD